MREFQWLLTINQNERFNCKILNELNLEYYKGQFLLMENIMIYKFEISINENEFKKSYWIFECKIFKNKFIYKLEENLDQQIIWRPLPNKEIEHNKIITVSFFNKIEIPNYNELFNKVKVNKQEIPHSIEILNNFKIFYNNLCYNISLQNFKEYNYGIIYLMANNLEISFLLKNENINDEQIINNINENAKKYYKELENAVLELENFKKKKSIPDQQNVISPILNMKTSIQPGSSSNQSQHFQFLPQQFSSFNFNSIRVPTSSQQPQQQPSLILPQNYGQTLNYPRQPLINEIKGKDYNPFIKQTNNHQVQRFPAPHLKQILPKPTNNNKVQTQFNPTMQPFYRPIEGQQSLQNNKNINLNYQNNNLNINNNLTNQQQLLQNQRLISSTDQHLSNSSITANNLSQLKSTLNSKYSPKIPPGFENINKTNEEQIQKQIKQLSQNNLEKQKNKYDLNEQIKHYNILESGNIQQEQFKKQNKEIKNKQPIITNHQKETVPIQQKNQLFPKMALFFKSKNNQHEKLFYKGFIYNINTISDNGKRYWRCQRRYSKCPGTAITDKNNSVTTRKDHDHEPLLVPDNFTLNNELNENLNNKNIFNNNLQNEKENNSFEFPINNLNENEEIAVEQLIALSSSPSKEELNTNSDSSINNNNNEEEIKKIKGKSKAINEEEQKNNFEDLTNFDEELINELELKRGIKESLKDLKNKNGKLKIGESSNKKLKNDENILDKEKTIINTDLFEKNEDNSKFNENINEVNKMDDLHKLINFNKLPTFKDWQNKKISVEKETSQEFNNIKNLKESEQINSENILNSDNQIPLLTSELPPSPKGKRNKFKKISLMLPESSDQKSEIFSNEGSPTISQHSAPAILEYPKSLKEMKNDKQKDESKE